VKKGPNCPTVLPRPEVLFTWIVYLDRAPLHSPKELGSVQAANIVAARSEAKAQWPGLELLVQSAASARVRPVTALPLPHEVKQPINAPVSPRKGRDVRRPRSKGQYDAFCQAKRAAHAVAKRDAEAMNPTTRSADV
jgi:hypothetical protein